MASEPWPPRRRCQSALSSGGDQQGAALRFLESPSAGDRDVDAGCPASTKAGRFAVTITAATLPVRGSRRRGCWTPMRSSIACSDWRGERDVVEGVAGAVEADHEAIADELVLAHALDVGEVLDAST